MEWEEEAGIIEENGKSGATSRMKILMPGIIPLVVIIELLPEADLEPFTGTLCINNLHGGKEDRNLGQTNFSGASMRLDLKWVSQSNRQ